MQQVAYAEFQLIYLLREIWQETASYFLGFFYKSTNICFIVNVHI